MRRALIWASMAVFGFATNADADCFRRRVVREEVVVVKEVVAVPVAVATVPVIVPAAAYQYVAPPYQPAFAPQAYAAPQYAAPQQPGLTDAQVDQLINRIQQRLQATPQNQPQQPAAPPVVMPPQTRAPAASSGAYGVLQQRCAACHSGTQAKGGTAFFGNDGQPVQLAGGTRARAALLADVGKMPPSANGDLKSPHAVPDNEIAVLKQWAAE
jgi:hypothetical protein